MDKKYISEFLPVYVVLDKPKIKSTEDLMEEDIVYVFRDCFYEQDSPRYFEAGY